MVCEGDYCPEGPWFKSGHSVVHHSCSASQRSQAAPDKASPVKNEERIQTPPDYDFPLQTPAAKEIAAALRPAHLILNLTTVPEPVVEIFRDQLVPFKDAKNPALVCFLSRGDKYRYYSIPFSVLVPLLGWVRLSDEKRPRWRLNLVPKKHALVARNGPRVETINLQPYYNKNPQ